MLVVRRKRKRETRGDSVQCEHHFGPSPGCGRPDTMWIDEAEGEVKKLDWRPKKLFEGITACGDCAYTDTFQSSRG